MRILLVVTSFNGLSQRIYEQLRRAEHLVSVVFGAREDEVRAAVTSFDPELILCPFLKQRVPEDIWRTRLCVIIHPGITGDRGPSSLDWAILNREVEWGVTALEADAEMDAGDIWATGNFSMRAAPKASLYRREVTNTAAQLVDEVLSHLSSSGFHPTPLDYARADVRGCLRPLLRQAERAIDWAADDTKTILDKIRAADSFPGVLDELCGLPVYLFGAHNERTLHGDRPKQILAQRHGAVCISTIDGAIWVSHLKRKMTADRKFMKLPASGVLGERIKYVPEAPIPVLPLHELETFKEIGYRESGEVGYLFFDFHNGAMGTEQCQRLLAAYREALKRNTRVLVLMGGGDFFSNGIHLNHIEAADDKAQASWDNINAIDDVVQAILETRSKITVAALRGNAGAGGAMMPLACDYVFARDGVVLNPHYKSMGLFGSEYWTYTLPRRVGEATAKELTEACLPLGVLSAADLGMVDEVLASNPAEFQPELEERVQGLARPTVFERLLAAKLELRDRDEARKPLVSYRAEELEKMRDCFWGEASSYPAERFNFVYKVCPAQTPARLTIPRSARRPLKDRVPLERSAA